MGVPRVDLRSPGWGPWLLLLILHAGCVCRPILGVASQVTGAWHHCLFFFTCRHYAGPPGKFCWIEDSLQLRQHVDLGLRLDQKGHACGLMLTQRIWLFARPVQVGACVSGCSFWGWLPIILPISQCLICMFAVWSERLANPSHEPGHDHPCSIRWAMLLVVHDVAKWT